MLVNCIYKFIQNVVFSVKNSPNGKHKTVTILGLKIKIKKKILIPNYNEIQIVKNRIVFNNFNGKGFGCNPKYIAAEIIRQKLPYELIWLLEDNVENNLPDEVKAMSFYSQKAMECVASAKFIISNCRMNFYIGSGIIKKTKQKYIQTWHGCLAFKKIEKDLELNKAYENYLNFAKIDSEYMDCLISPSKFDTKTLKNCFYFDGEFLEVGYPRNDIFFYSAEEKNKIKDKVHEILNISKDKKIVLYAPTFRDNTNLSVYKFDDMKLIETLNKKYNSDFILVTRLHPNILSLTEGMKQLYPKAVNASLYADIQELLLSTDVFITDYSSCIWDFANSKKPAFVLAKDIEMYKKERDFYIDIYSMPFSVAQTEDELFNNIANFDKDKYVAKLDSFNEQRGSFDDGNASKRIVEIIKQGMEEQ